MTSAAAKRGKARLEAFRASRKTSSTAPKNVDDDDAVKPVTTTTTTTTPVETTRTITASPSSSSYPVVSFEDAKHEDARTMRLDVVDEVRAVARAEAPTTRLLVDEYKDDDAMRTSTTGSGSEIIGTGSDGIGGGEVRNAYSMLADDYASAVATTRLAVETEEEKEMDGNLTTSSDRAREQYERVMRAIGVESDSLYGRGVAGGEGEEEEDDDSARGDNYNQKDAAEPLAPNSELDAIIDCVRTDGAIGNVAARAVKDDQSEIAMLQDVIDEMTTEKLGLMRGLQKSQAMVDELAAENDSLTQRFNETRAQLAQTQRELDELWMKYQERGPQSDSLANDGDSSARVRSLAAEVVSLEERLQDFEETKEANARLEQEAKRANQRAVDAEIMLEATRAEQVMFKEKIVGSELMKTLESLSEGDDGAFLCAWLKKSSFAAEEEAQAKAKMVKESNDSAAVDEEQLKILSSINDLLGELEIEKKSLARQLNSANEVKQQLLERNGLLESQLAKTLSRLAEEGFDEEEEWSDEDVVKPRRGLFSLFRRRQE
jgi:hypothetical protein